ncbi:MAG: prepilin-type N-terminal cleavage/methylation domain-containing protein [Nitrospinae bacterium]|nr:prepilin-type N-terminal cleavage/methylation domain-containing protein [Nitrospinota bacterium]
MKTFLNNKDKESGFTLIELVLVLVLIGILASVATERMMRASEQAEITAEDRTIDVLRSNMVNNFGIDLLSGIPAQFPQNPFNNLSKVPQGYNRQRNFQPTGKNTDADIWVFVTGGGGNVTPQQAGTTLATFQTSGTIYHQRKDGTVVKWPYDQVNGIIGKKQIDRASAVKQRAEQDKILRGEPTEQQRLNKTL